MFAADASIFLADFGSPVSWTPSAGGTVVTGLMLFDQPDADIQGGEVASREYEVTFEAAAWPGLKRGEPLVIGGDGGGATYRLRSQPHAKEDGVFHTAKLNKA